MTDSIFMQCMEAIRDRIQDLDLPGLQDNRVTVRRLPHDGEVYFPGVSIHPVEEKYHQGTNMRESIGYGCAVTIVVNNNNNQDYLLDRLLYWREIIRRHFVENDGLVGVSGSCTVKVEHGHPLAWNDLVQKNYDVTSLVLRVYVLETRVTSLE
jgi:hypothetical protein